MGKSPGQRGFHFHEVQQVNCQHQVQKTKRVRLPPTQLTLADLQSLVRQSFDLPDDWQSVFFLNDGSKASTERFRYSQVPG